MVSKPAPVSLSEGPANYARLYPPNLRRIEINVNYSACLLSSPPA